MLSLIIESRLTTTNKLDSISTITRCLTYARILSFLSIFPRQKMTMTETYPMNIDIMTNNPLNTLSVINDDKVVGSRPARRNPPLGHEAYAYEKGPTP
jgi:hypothetical protein